MNLLSLRVHLFHFHCTRFTLSLSLSLSRVSCLCRSNLTLARVKGGEIKDRNRYNIAYVCERVRQRKRVRTVDRFGQSAANKRERERVKK